MSTLNNNFQTIILAAGKGKRMEDDSRPKVLHQLGQFTIIDHILNTIDRLESAFKPIVVVGYKKEMLIEHLGDRVRYAIQEEQLGTGHATGVAIPQVQAENVMVMSGDIPLVTEASLRAIMQCHLESNQVITPVTSKVSSYEGENFNFHKLGRIVRDELGSIQKIVEYKDATAAERQILEFNTGLYAFKTAWLAENLSKLKPENAQNEYYLTDLLHLAVLEGRRIVSHAPSPREVMGINTKDELELATKFLNYMPDFS